MLSEASMVNKMEYRVECQILGSLHKENRISRRFPIGTSIGYMVYGIWCIMDPLLAVCISLPSFSRQRTLDQDMASRGSSILPLLALSPRQCGALCGGGLGQLGGGCEGSGRSYRTEVRQIANQDRCAQGMHYTYLSISTFYYTPNEYTVHNTSYT